MVVVEPVALAKSDERYPSELLGLPGGPDVIYCLGNLALFDRPAVGICGSRSATPQALEHAREFGRLAAEQGFVVVSGYARGVDVGAHLGAMEAGGGTIAVLAEGIAHFRLRREFADLVTSDSLLALSTFRPGASWAGWRAMLRNRYIVGLARGLFVVEARERSGTFEAGLECLRQRKPLWVIEYHQGGPHREGNAKLIAAGGVPIRGRRVLNNLLEEARLATHPKQERLALSITES